MRLIERYILRRAKRAFLLTLGGLVATLWVTQVLRQLDVVTAKGQAIWVFLVMTILALPALVQLVAPIAFLVATLVTVNGLANDSELPVISGAGASRATVGRPIIVLGVAVMIAVAISQHVLAPASLSTLRALLTRVRGDVIAMLVQDGGFRSVGDGLTLHIRQQAPDGSFLGIFVSDERDPAQSMQYSAAQGMIVERAGGSFLVMQRGELIRDDRTGGKNNVVAFETYALDLSQIGAPSNAAAYKAKERSTFYLLEPEPDDALAKEFPQRLAVELHDRTTGPLYTLAFAFIALAFLGRPRTSRQDRNLAIATAALLCLTLRAGGFAAVAAAKAYQPAITLMYLVPVSGIAFGLVAMMRESWLRMPRFLETATDRVTQFSGRVLGRFVPRFGGIGGAA